MANPKQTLFRKDLRQRIIDALVEKPDSPTTVAKRIQANYYTVRDEMLVLENTGIIRERGFRGNARVMELSPVDRVPQNESIPYAKGPKGNPVKLTEAMAFVGKENTLPVGNAAVAAPKILTRLFMAALKYSDSKGSYNVNPILDNIKKELDNHITHMEVFLNILKAIRDNDVFWEEAYIRVIPHDVDFDREAVLDAYRYYYPGDV